MQIKRLVIENFKSIERIELIEPNPFTVFVGPNGSGKSNIFEALEFANLVGKTNSLAESLFGGRSEIITRKYPANFVSVNIDFPFATLKVGYDKEDGFYTFGAESNKVKSHSGQLRFAEIDQFHIEFHRIFVQNESSVKLTLNDNLRLASSASNLEKVLKRVLSNETLKNEIFEWLELFVPEFRAIDVQANPFDGKETLLWYEQSSEKPFTKDLISDGTYNILALLTAVYQSDDKPQFLCIEEPENGLHPQVAGELVDFFRIMCEERGHYIWLNTHSKSMAERVRPEEFVVVDKKNGATQVQQFRKEDFFGMRTDEAWLTNSLNGGLAW